MKALTWSTGEQTSESFRIRVHASQLTAPYFVFDVEWVVVELARAVLFDLLERRINEKMSQQTITILTTPTSFCSLRAQLEVL